MKKYSRDEAFDVVEAGYDRLAGVYSEERAGFDNWAEVNAFATALPERARVLDAGSGTGTPVARHLSQAGHSVVGIDISEEMLATARRNAPEATFQRMNMTAIDFSEGSFDGVISCYAIIHVPREHHGRIFESFRRILKPGGVVLASVASWAWEEFADYMGVDMFWSHFNPDESQALIRACGFDIEFARDVKAGGEKHHWVLARKRDGA